MEISADREESYVRLAREIRLAIISGRIPVGERLPSGREVEAAGTVGRSTLAKAVALLRREGLVATRAGQGVYVIARPQLQVIELRPGDTVAGRPATDEERAAGGELLQWMTVVTRADGSVEVYPASTTVCHAGTGDLCPRLG